MKRVDFLLSNNRHHVDMMAPVVDRLTVDGGIHCRLLSLCEVRGLPSPTNRFRSAGAAVRRLLPLPVRRGWMADVARSVKQRPTSHSVSRSLLWSLVLSPRLAMLWSRPPDLVVLPNDVAYPYDRIVSKLESRRIPFLLMQEGIRFPLPGEPEDRVYGASSACAVAAWGKSSAAYFRSVGVDENRLHLTGSPRFDAINSIDWQQMAQSMPFWGALGPRNLLLLTNPIDDQGFCSTKEKHELVRRFVDHLEPLLNEGEIRLIVKLHAGESFELYESALRGASACHNVVILTDTPLYPLLAVADAAVILASTVGLEALLFDVPLAVLEIPRHGFIFDYVDRGGARGLRATHELPHEVRKLLHYDSKDVAAYISHHLATTTESATIVSDLIARLADRRHTGG